MCYEQNITNSDNIIVVSIIAETTLRIYDYLGGMTLFNLLAHQSNIC